MPIKRLTLKKILSFNDTTVDLGQLNVLIGPNGVGKSNLIEVIGLLQATPTNLSAAILRGGGIRQWLWLGEGPTPPVATLQCELVLPNGRKPDPLLYSMSLSADSAGGPAIGVEHLSRTVDVRPDRLPTYFSRTYNFAELEPQKGAVERRRAKSESFSIPPSESVFSRFKNPADQTPITAVGQFFEQIRIYREFRSGAGAGARHGVSTSAVKDTLLDGADNLALVLNKLDVLGVHPRLRDYLRRFCERFEDVKVDVGDGLARLLLRETGLSDPISAARMSDGTLKFLALLAVLFQPSTTPMICIEEPEAGLHPDAMQLVAEALTEASQSTQLIVTTHSEALVDALTGSPETVLVCERGFDCGTQMKRLSHDELALWLERYSLGQLWRKGEIGGGRW